jgi:hypothetical protein
MTVQRTSDRWRAVRANSGRLLGAAVEDAARREIIYVANASMATFLADVLALERGEALPTPGEQHQPPRFQLTHDPMGVSPESAVVYMHRGKGRALGEEPSELPESIVAPQK